MSIRQTDLKLLWGRSGNRCAICKILLSIDPKYASKAVPLGEQAHIVAKEPDGPRGKSILTPEERDQYDNLILLCPTDHEVIDKNVDDYPVEKLHLIKSQHELWVQEQLAGADELELPERIYASLLDSFVENCAAEHWQTWASRALDLEPIWPVALIVGVPRFEISVAAAIWPGKHEELERALITLATTLRTAHLTFSEYGQYEASNPDAETPSQDDFYRGPKFYKELREWDPKRYDELFNQWQEWLEKSQALIFEATRAANWTADCARRYVNPEFFALRGKFRLLPTLLSDIPAQLWVPEYTAKERAQLELPRIRGRPMIGERGVHDAAETPTSLRTRVSASDGRAGTSRSRAGGAFPGVRAFGAGDPELGGAGGAG